MGTISIGRNKAAIILKLMETHDFKILSVDGNAHDIKKYLLQIKRLDAIDVRINALNSTDKLLIFSNEVTVIEADDETLCWLKLQL